MIDARINIIRAVLVGVAASITARAFPGVALWVLSLSAFAIIGLIYPVLSAGSCNCSGSVPSSIQVDIASIADSGCTDCDTDYNGSWVVTGGTLSGTTCTWSYTFPAFCSSFLGDYDTLHIRLTDVFVLSVIIGNSGPTLIGCRWSNSYGSAPDCTAWSSTSVSLAVDWPVIPNTCNASASTCNITSL